MTRWKENRQFSRNMTKWASESVAAHIGCAWWLNQYTLITLSAGNWCRQWRATQGRLLLKEFLKCTFSKLRRAESMCQWWMVAEKRTKTMLLISYLGLQGLTETSHKVDKKNQRSKMENIDTPVSIYVSVTDAEVVTFWCHRVFC